MLNASKYAKSLGIETLKEVSEKSNISLTTLHEWAAMKGKKGAEGRRFAFEAVCEKIARENALNNNEIDGNGYTLRERIENIERALNINIPQ